MESKLYKTYISLIVLCRKKNSLEIFSLEKLFYRTLLNSLGTVFYKTCKEFY